MSDQIQEVTAQYDDQCKEIGKDCPITLTVPQDIKQPIYVYYQLDNFYQNHRRYVKSRSFDQLKGKDVDISTDCDPIVKNKDIYPGVKSFDQKTTLDPEAKAWPCGLVAKSFFNDTYTLTNKQGVKITIDPNGIAWESDKEYKFANGPDMSKQWMDVTNGKLNLKIVKFNI